MPQTDAAPALLAALCALALAACGSDDGAGNPDSELSAEQATAPLEGAPPQLAAIREQANQLLDGGTEAFEARLAELQGTPGRRQQVGVVVRALPARVPLLPVPGRSARRPRSPSSACSPTTPRTRRATFLEELPLPYPSYLDPDQDIAAVIEAPAELPRDRASTTPRASSSTPARAATPTRRRWPRTSTATRGGQVASKPASPIGIMDRGSRGHHRRRSPCCCCWSSCCCPPAACWR